MTKTNRWWQMLMENGGSSHQNQAEQPGVKEERKEHNLMTIPPLPLLLGWFRSPRRDFSWSNLAMHLHSPTDDRLSKECPHRLLRLGRQGCKHLSWVDAGKPQQLLCGRDDASRSRALQCLGLEGLRNVDEAFRCVCNDGRILPTRNGD